ncbi:MAG: Ku protein [Nitrosomonadales bacterium]|nr:Ku protein [Nitrosomonadales bacterium]
MSRPIWKGAISFGLIHIPIEVYSAQNTPGIDLDMLDRRDFAPIGYRRYNKVTGKEIKQEHIVKGYEYEKGEYVVLTEADIKKANAESTQTIDIQSFVDAEEISPLFFEQPYYLKPSKGGDKVYALLRETLKSTNKIGIAQIVIRTKQHLAALMPVDEAIVLNLLRYAEDIRPAADLNLPASGSKKIQVSDKEIKMAASLVNEMTESWNPEQYKDTFREDLLKVVKKKIKARQTHTLTEAEEEEVETVQKPSNVVDLMELLKKSIGHKTGKKTPAAKTPAEKTMAEKPRSKQAARK